MRTMTASQMRELDRRCIEEVGIPGAVLMNTAGASVYAQIHDKGPIGIVCGKGNNGGDGYVVARLALLSGRDTRVVLTAPVDHIAGDAATFLRVYQRLGGAICVAATEEEATRAVKGLDGCRVLVDALLGTGISGELRGPVRAAIEAWPRVHTVAVDVPSGLNADTGLPCGCAVRADVTVTFQFAKRGYENPAASPYIGRLVIADIGIPEICAEGL